MEAILDKVLAAYDIEVPQDLVDDEVIRMILELNHKMKYESLASGRYIGFMQDDRTDLMEKFKEEAFRLVKTRLVLQGIIEAENFDSRFAHFRGEFERLTFKATVERRWEL